jgi:5-methylcytosine-specific restriction endonuclease McrA
MDSKTRSKTAVKKVRDTRVRGQIKPGVRQALWSKTAGRCTLCNRRVLGDGRTFVHSVGAAEMAHIQGATATAGSPRGLDGQACPGDDSSALGSADLESEENLLLCCHDCHRIIDDADHVALFTVEKLRELKAAHEHRIERVTSHGLLTRTAVLRLGSSVRQSPSRASQHEVAEALFARNYLGLVESQWSGDFTCWLDGDETDPTYWLAAQTKIDRALRVIDQAVEQGDVSHISVFAIAPVPVLVMLGSRLDDKVEAQLWEKQRGAGWGWRNDEAPVDFVFSSERHAAHVLSADGEAAHVTDVVLVCSVTAEVNPDRFPAALETVPRLVLRPDGLSPSPMLLGNEKTLSNYGSAFRDMLAEAERLYPRAERWHLVAAVPTTVAVESGRAFMREVQPPVHLYQRTAEQVYVDVLTVNRPAAGDGGQLSVGPSALAAGDRS